MSVGGKAKKAAKAQPVRRKQADRAEATRERVLSAAMELLHVQGYSGATTLAIQRAAGVSMGAMQHQFPTKAKLMAAVVERYTARRLERYEAAVRGASDPRDRMRRLIDASGSMIGEPEMAASVEILLARRSDPELEAETAPILNAIDRRVGLLLEEAARDSGLSDMRSVNRLRLLNNAMTRGMTMDIASGGDAAEVRAAFDIWRETALELFFGPEAPRKKK